MHWENPNGSSKLTFTDSPIEESPLISELLQKGFGFHQAGRLHEAEVIYRDVLKKQSRHPDALNLLGVIAHQVGKNEIAVNLFEKAISICSSVPDYYNNRGEAYRALHKNDLAITSFEQALAIKADYAEAHNNLGNALLELGCQLEAISRYEQALAIKPDYAEALNNLGNALRKTGCVEDAVSRYEHALAIKPVYAEAHNNLGNALCELGRKEEAIARYEQAIACKPKFIDAHLHLGNSYKEIGQIEKAIACYKQALTINPDYAEAHNNLGNVFKDLGQAENAIICYEKAIAIKPYFSEGHSNLGNALKEINRVDDAVLCYEKALAIQPEIAETHNNLGNAFLELGRYDEAISSYKQAISIKPDYADAHRHLAMIRPKKEQVGKIQSLLSCRDISYKDSMYFHYALGDILNHDKSYTRAFEHYQMGNFLKRKTISYNSKSHSDFVDRQIKTFTKSSFLEQVACGADTELPVFIVGMPRSGTTLVEQIVSSHPQVFGAGELTYIQRIEEAISTNYKALGSYPECMLLLNESDLLRISTEYLNKLSNISRTAIRITDKMPANFLRIGLIRTLFPRARIIHCKRNALDTCTSIFLNYFVVGHEYSFDLTELGQYYLDYQRLLEHWNKIFPAEILNVQYEELVMDQEKVSREVIEYLGLEWDSKCLKFYENKRAVRTASYLQVRRPIYKKSINRWKQYEEHLGALVSVLKGAN